MSSAPPTSSLLFLLRPASDAAEKISSPAMNMRRRPNTSAARPPRISRPPNAIAYPVTIHCTADAEKPSSRSIDARATFTMLKSRTTMNAAVRMSARPSPRCPEGRPDGDGPERPDGSGTMAGPDGSGTMAGPDGSGTMAGPDGSGTMAGPDGSGTMAGPDRSGTMAGPAASLTIA